MKTTTVWTAIAIVAMFGWAQLGHLFSKGELLNPLKTPAYVIESVQDFNERHDVTDRVSTWWKREWRGVRMTVTNNINHYVEVASTVRAGGTAEEIQPAVITNASGAVTRSLRPVMRPAVSSAPKTSIRPMARPAHIEQKAAIQKALEEANG